MERKVSFEVGEYYHIYNRGVGKENVFIDTTDYDRFQQLLYIRNSDIKYRAIRYDLTSLTHVERGDSVVDIFSYVLMPNHFHILVHEKEEGGISKFMSRLLTSYSMYFNNKYERTGPLMCRPFRSKHISNNEYFRHCMTYIHQNIIEKKDVKSTLEKLRSYPYSSYFDYFVKERDKSLILNKKALPIDISELKTISQMKQTMKEFDDYTYKY